MRKRSCAWLRSLPAGRSDRRSREPSDGGRLLLSSGFCASVRTARMQSSRPFCEAEAVATSTKGSSPHRQPSGKSSAAVSDEGQLVWHRRDSADPASRHHQSTAPTSVRSGRPTLFRASENVSARRRVRMVRGARGGAARPARGPDRTYLAAQLACMCVCLTAERPGSGALRRRSLGQRGRRWLRRADRREAGSADAPRFWQYRGRRLVTAS